MQQSGYKYDKSMQITTGIRKEGFVYKTIVVLFDAMLRGKDLTEKEIENTIDEIMETVSKVASEYGERAGNE